MISAVECRNDLGGFTRGRSFRWAWWLLSDIHVKARRKKATARGRGFTAPSAIHCWKSGAGRVPGTCEGVDMVAGAPRPVVREAKG